MEAGEEKESVEAGEEEESVEAGEEEESVEAGEEEESVEAGEEEKAMEAGEEEEFTREPGRWHEKNQAGVDEKGATTAKCSVHVFVLERQKYTEQ
ncbi:hypothetical protein NDU88_000656 [Pleurodeles waltl]|uniref:Uncharacterized protein n=1 Tax=Pleurodeles waltl TaxID=8319 RepID=A0AAV7M0U0_PLEWA|nr:hypothetical protein NDU88_000656 [Pleurodeles waltl]